MMFTIYDEEFNVVPLPKDELGYGITGLDLFVSSVGQDVTEHSMTGVPGNIITGYRDNGRDMSISVRLKAKDTVDYRLKRDRVYAFFKRLGTFFITEKHQGNKLMKVSVVERFQFERINKTVSTVDVPLKIVGQPYWISRFKSMDLHENGGVPFDGGWSFGMGLDVDKTTYQYSNESEFNIYNAGTVPLKTIQEKDNCIITIEVNQSVNNFRLYDATGRYFEWNPMRNNDWGLSSGNEIILNGHYMTMNNTPIMERTNRYFMRLLSGDNIFRMEGLTNYTITFDFRFKYD